MSTTRLSSLLDCESLPHVQLALSAAPAPYTVPEATAPTAPTDSLSLVDEIERMGDLRDHGIIPDEYFKAGKKKLFVL